VKTLIKLRPRLLSIHRIGGLVATVPLLVLAVTGCVMAFESEIDGFFHPSLLKVVPHGNALPLSEIIPRVAAELRPQEHIQICVFSSNPTNSNYFTIVGSTFVDQYTGRVL
jgi:uncharacterized iron-regulated membrane protein